MFTPRVKLKKKKKKKEKRHQKVSRNLVAHLDENNSNHDTQGREEIKKNLIKRPFKSFREE